MENIQIPKGAIATRIPRPLKPSEVRRVREMEGGDPTTAHMEALAAKFARCEKQQEATDSAIKTTRQNLWQRGDI